MSTVVGTHYQDSPGENCGIGTDLLYSYMYINKNGFNFTFKVSSIDESTPADHN